MTQTPLLDAPLSGPAYAVSGFGKLPHVVFILEGQVRVMPEVESSSVHNGHLKSVVPVIPDVPIGHFRLNLYGGGQGYLVNTRDLCGGRIAAKVQYIAQNGKRLTQQPPYQDILRRLQVEEKRSMKAETNRNARIS